MRAASGFGSSPRFRAVSSRADSHGNDGPADRLGAADETQDTRIGTSTPSKD